MTTILAVLLIVISGILCYLFYLLFISQKKISSQDTELSEHKAKYEEELKKWTKYVSVLKAEVHRLSKWTSVADADKKAQEMIREAKSIMDKANSDAQQKLSDANQQADSIMNTAKSKIEEMATESKQKIKAKQDEIQYILNSATNQAKQILDTANIKAKEIAGGAYDIMKNASQYERTAKAMKNIINGYGDQYIAPAQSLLDDLAKDFGHTQAGQELATAREFTKTMITNNTAATCDYVEANRRETAINFVIDAFNGKVDSILSRVKSDNYGTLSQEIQDAFSVVNYNGKAFREARITEEYLEPIPKPQLLGE